MSDEGTCPQSGAGLPREGFVRLAQLIGDPPYVAAIIPISKAHLLRLIREGRFPAPLKVAPRLSLFPVAAVRAWIEDPKA